MAQNPTQSLCVMFFLCVFIYQLQIKARRSMKMQLKHHIQCYACVLIYWLWNKESGSTKMKIQGIKPNLVNIFSVLPMCVDLLSLPLDGFPTKLFHMFWDIIANDSWQDIEEYRNNINILKDFISTFITIIPKALQVLCTNKYHLINLSNTIYKIISKVMANNLIIL